MFREIINTMETRPSSPKGVFCSGVYYTGTRDNAYKDCSIRQECSQLGAFRTSTSIRTRDKAGFAREIARPKKNVECRSVVYF